MRDPWSLLAYFMAQEEVALTLFWPRHLGSNPQRIFYWQHLHWRQADRIQSAVVQTTHLVPPFMKIVVCCTVSYNKYSKNNNIFIAAYARAPPHTLPCVASAMRLCPRSKSACTSYSSSYRRE